MIHKIPCPLHPQSKGTNLVGRHRTSQCLECIKFRRRAHYDEKGHTMRETFRNQQNHARRRGIAWALSFVEWLRVISLPCAYAPRPQKGITVGIDRRDNMVGYTSGNSIPCCIRHNRIKGAYWTFEQMLETSHRCDIQCGNRQGRSKLPRA